MPLIALLFLLVPIIELFVIVQAAQAIGTPQTLLLLLVVSVVGAWLVKVEGLGVWRRFATTMSRGELPHKEVLDGALILVAGALMLTPGFVTDAVGLLFLFPPSRAVVRTALISRFKAGALMTVFGAPETPQGHVYESDAWEAESWESDPDRTGRDDNPPEVGR